MECSEGSQKGLKYGPSGKCYLHDGTPEGIAAAKEKCIKQALAMGEKLEDAAGPSLEYLTAFHKFVTGHPHIYGQIKEEIHKRARGSAGGQRKALKAQEEDIDIEDLSEHLTLDESLAKVTNSAYVEGDIVETEEYFDVPTVFAKEGVFTGTNGIPTLKKYEVLKANAPKFLGVPITEKHLETDTLRPSDRWLGHAISSNPRDDHRDIFGISRYYKKDLNSTEIEKIKNKQFPDASPGYFTVTKREEGEFNGKKYMAVEEGPYVVVEYANFFNGTKGACSREDGCGPFQNAAGLAILDGEIVKTDCKRYKKMVDDSKIEELTKQLNAAAGAQSKCMEELAAMKEKMKMMESKVGNSSPEVDALKAEIATLKESNKQLNEKFTSKETAEATAKEQAFKADFVKNLNAANVPEADKLWTEVKGLNPVQYEAWKITNSAKLKVEVEGKDLKGKKKMDASGDDFDIDAENKKLYNY